MRIKWDGKLKIGNKLVDAEHKLIISLINAIFVILRHPEEREELIFTIDQLSKFSKEHFENEEKLQIQCQFPHYMENKLGHQKLLLELNNIRDSFDNLVNISDKRSEAYNDEAKRLAKLLQNWFVVHILKSDMKMKGYLPISSDQ